MRDDNRNRGCFPMLILGLILLVLVLLVEIFGYAHKTYEAITGGEQYSELKMITESIKEDAIRWKEKSSSESTMAAQGQ